MHAQERVFFALFTEAVELGDVHLVQQYTDLLWDPSEVTERCDVVTKQHVCLL